MQHISVLRILSSFCINTQLNYIRKITCSKTKSNTISLQKFKSPLALWPPRGVTSTELKMPHISDPSRFLVSSLISHQLPVFWMLSPRVGTEPTQIDWRGPGIPGKLSTACLDGIHWRRYGLNWLIRWYGWINSLYPMCCSNDCFSAQDNGIAH